MAKTSSESASSVFVDEHLKGGLGVQRLLNFSMILQWLLDMPQFANEFQTSAFMLHTAPMQHGPCSANLSWLSLKQQMVSSAAWGAVETECASISARSHISSADLEWPAPCSGLLQGPLVPCSPHQPCKPLSPPCLPACAPDKILILS